MNGIRPTFWTISLLLFSVLAAAEDNKAPKAEPNVEILNKVLSNMDESADPCQNFQNYSVRYIKPVKQPTVITEFITMFEELNKQTFEAGSLEWKTQRVYNICLSSRFDGLEPETVLTVEELEHRFQVSLGEFLNYYYGRFISQNTTVHLMYWRDLLQFIELLKSFDASDWKDKEEIEHVFELALGFPEIEATQSCVKFVAARMGLAVNLLYEERFLGPEKVRQLQAKVLKIFESVRQQINTSLQANPLNWTTAEITALRENINNFTLSLGGIPQNVNRRDYVTDYFKDLEFSDRDDMKRYANRKFSLWRLFKRPDYRPSNPNTVSIRNNTAIVSYRLLANHTFELESHDLFQMTPLGIHLAFYMLNSYKPSNCKEFNDTPLSPRYFYVEDINGTLQQFCWKVHIDNKLLAKQHTIHLLLDLVHRAYFSPDSSFSQTQPNFTTKPLSQLSFLRLAQSSVHLFGFHTELLNNLLPKQPAFLQAFNCNK
ncbi:uncharacterized protein LOC108025032 [Drosophila biarmipes]|uniref:uncharacterized protein LOC108025032 n=1 Tax=Drosophila biarmipes TaxID=125945 RepID=UPI0007E5F214|nr:uncharacterized protein LOC108025032 [Drosophila biarmipes]